MGSSAPAPQPFQPPDQAGAASGLSGAANTLSNIGGVTTAAAIPGYQNIYNAVTNNPYYQPTQTQAGATGQAGVNFGQSEVAGATGLQGLATSLGQYAPAIAQQAFDPQGAVYQQGQQQNLDQANALAAQSGLAGSPFGAGMAMDANRNFNTDWLKNTQSRQLAGIQGLEGLASAAGGLQTAAGSLGTSGLNNMTTGGSLANDTYNQQQTYIKNALDALVAGDTAAGQPYTASGALDTSYLGIGQAASANALASYSAQQQADQSFWSGIGGLLGLGTKGGGTVGGSILGAFGI